MTISRFTFPLIQKSQTPCVRLEISTEMTPERVVCEEEMSFVLGTGWKDRFLNDADGKRSFAEEETDEKEKKFLLDQAEQLEDIAMKGLGDYDGNVELSFRRAEYIPRRNALKLCYSPSSMDIELEIDALKRDPKMVAEIERLLKEQEPDIVITEDVLRPTYEATAESRLLAGDEFPLVGLPDEIKRAIRDDRADVCYIGLRCNKKPNASGAYHAMRRIPFVEIRRALKCQSTALVFTARNPDDPGLRGNFVCLIEPPAADYDPKTDPKRKGRGRGLIVFFRTDLLVKILETKHNISFAVMPTICQSHLWPASLPKQRGRNAPARQEASVKEVPAADAAPDPNAEPPQPEDLDDEEEEAHDDEDPDNGEPSSGVHDAV